MTAEAKHVLIVALIAGSTACRALDVVDVDATVVARDGDGGGGDGDGDGGGLPVSYAEVVTADAPQAWYRFTRDDGQDTPRRALDASGHALDGLYGSAARGGAPGALAGSADTAAFVIDAGTGSITLPLAAAVGASAFTIEAWANLPALAIDDLGAIYRDDSVATRGFAFGVDAGLHPALRDLSGGASVVSDATLGLGVWSHLAVVQAAGVATLYVDGVARGSGPFVPRPTGAQPSLGALDAGALDAFLDEVALYDYALPAARIAAHADAGRDGAHDAVCSLTASNARVLTGAGNILEDLDFALAEGPALVIDGADGTIVRRVRITLGTGTAIRVQQADDVVLEDVEIIYTAAPAADGAVGIVVDTSARATIQRLRIRGAASGVVLAASPGATLRYVEGVDFAGQAADAALVAFGAGSANGVLDGFSLGTSDGTPTSIGHGVATRAANTTVRHGVIRGNIAPAGAGIAIIHTPTTAEEALVEDVEVVGVNNHCFDLTPGITTTFRRVGCGPTLCQDQGRGAPAAGAGEGWHFEAASSGTRLKDSRYTGLCGAALSDTASIIENDLAAGAFPSRPLLRQRFCWDP